MRIDWTLSGCTQDDEREIERVWESLQPGFEARLSALPEGDADLLIGVYHQIDEPGEPAWDVQAALNFPLGTSTAERTGEDLPQVLSGVVADLSQRLDTLDASVAEPVDRRQRLESIRSELKSELVELRQRLVECEDRLVAAATQMSERADRAGRR